MKMNFRRWLRKQEGRNDPIGDLAGDAKQCPPRTQADDVTDWREHLCRNGACREALQTLEEAWKEYQEYLKS